MLQYSCGNRGVVQLWKLWSSAAVKCCRVHIQNLFIQCYLHKRYEDQSVNN